MHYFLRPPLVLGMWIPAALLLVAAGASGELDSLEDFDWGEFMGEGGGDFADDFPNESHDAERDFLDFDANGDGELDAFEIRCRFKGYLNERDMYYFYDQADTDHSGTVNRLEYGVYVKLPDVASQEPPAEAHV